jgi:hypothetical protein
VPAHCLLRYSAKSSPTTLAIDRECLPSATSGAHEESGRTHHVLALWSLARPGTLNSDEQLSPTSHKLQVSRHHSVVRLSAKRDILAHGNFSNARLLPATNAGPQHLQFRRFLRRNCRFPPCAALPITAPEWGLVSKRPRNHTRSAVTYPSLRRARAPHSHARSHSSPTATQPPSR